MNAFISDTVKRYQSDPYNLLQILNRIQAHYACVSPQTQRDIADELGIPQTQINTLVSFYSFLHESSCGKYDILFSDNITDLMQGKQALMDLLCERLKVTPGQTRPDGRVRVNDTSCIGMGDQGPAALVNGLTLTSLNNDRIHRISSLIEQAIPLSEWPEEYFTVHSHIRRTDILLKNDLEDGAAIKAALKRGEIDTLEEIKLSGLRGLGGAGFYTATKWKLCRATSDRHRYVLCNADEGEPGTFKDRILLQDHADLVFEGMTVCARVVGADKGFLYLRAEYRYLLPALEETLMRRRRTGLLGRNILGCKGFDFDIDIHLGAGAYICGEESALIESLEGKRGIPRIRPPFPVTHGYRNKPSVVDNVETLCAAAKIALHGSQWFTRYGTQASRGTKLLSISGDCTRPGIYEFPFGVTIREILADCGARATQAVQVAGAAGHCIPESEFERRISFEDLPTGGSLMIFNKRRNVLDIAQNFSQFFAHESCGFCTPCRVGTALLRDLVDKIYRGHGTRVDLEELRNIAEVMQEASHCGLGHTATLTLIDTLDKFPGQWDARLKKISFEPAFDLDGSLEEARQLSGRDDADAHIQ
jgi:[NiFe] hydrogenase diaphorase moiety large subunit